MRCQQLINDCLVIFGLLGGSVAGMLMTWGKEGYGTIRNLGLGLAGALVGGSCFACSESSNLDKIAFSFRDVVAAFAGSLIVLLGLWIWQQFSPQTCGGPRKAGRCIGRCVVRRRSVDRTASSERFHRRFRGRLARRAIDEHGHDPQHDADCNKDAGDRVLDRSTAGPRAHQERASQRTQDRKKRGRPKVRVVDVIAAQESTAMFTTGKHAESSSAVVPPSAGTSPTKVIRPKASSVVNPIATYGCAVSCALAERGRQNTLTAHAVHEPACHQHVDQRAICDGKHRDETEIQSGKSVRRPARPSGAVSHPRPAAPVRRA